MGGVNRIMSFCPRADMASACRFRPAQFGLGRRQRGGVRLNVLIALVAAILLAGAVGGWWLLEDIRRFAEAPLAVADGGATFDVERGTRYRDIIRQLRRQQISRAAPFYWRVLGRQMGVDGRLHAGEYALTPAITPRELLRKMAKGEVIQHPFLIVDGWTFRQLRLALANEAGLVQTLTTRSDAEIAAEFGIADGLPEGWFLPETYAWVKGERDIDVLRRAHRAMRRTLDELWVSRADDLPLKSPYDALVLASIIEKETGIANERARIGGVFTRRLRINMRLQTDPTVIYGMGSAYDGNIRRRDLETDTPYNTYTRFGLPPTPIALPGRPAIAAALQPEDGDSLYFVAVGDGSGRHVFSATLQEHNRAVGEYLRNLRGNR